MKRIGFSAAKEKVIEALKAGTFQHESRSSIDTKNLLMTGQVSSAEVCDAIKLCRGQDHTSSPHHQAPTIEVHVLKRDGWYIKFYFLEPDTMFISVHK